MFHIICALFESLFLPRNAMFFSVCHWQGNRPIERSSFSNFAPQQKISAEPAAKNLSAHWIENPDHWSRQTDQLGKTWYVENCLFFFFVANLSIWWHRFISTIMASHKIPFAEKKYFWRSLGGRQKTPAMGFLHHACASRFAASCVNV